jgi:choice-of-anchor A domain-containing protein
MIVLQEIMMSKLLKVTLLATAVFASGIAQADVLDLGFVKGANLFALGDLRMTGNSVDGSAIVSGNATLTRYNINRTDKDAFGSYSLVVGGNLNYVEGGIQNGSWYAAGTSSLDRTNVSSSSKGTDPGVSSLSSMASQAKSLSSALKTVAATGTVGNQYGGLKVTGTNSAVEVFNVDGSTLRNFNWTGASGLASGATLIFNVSGAASGFDQGVTNFASGFNVIYNFYEATQLNITNAGVFGSVLAPLATVTGSGGDIFGTAIVNNWVADVHITSGRGFNATNVQGLALSVPEPKPWAMGLIGIALIGFVGSRRRNNAALKFAPQPQEPSE